MRFSTAVSALAAASSVSAYAYTNGTEFTTTEVVTSYTTFCPSPTEIVEGGKTYTVTEATTLTITDCPCTLTHTYPAVPTTNVAVPIGTAPVPIGTAPAGTGVIPSGSYGNATIAPTAGMPTSAPSSTAPPFEGAANRATVAGGALVGLLGVVAYLL